jgi:hypothetical protein
MVVSAQQINSDETRKVKLRTDYDQKKMAQEQANQPAGAAGGGYDPSAAFRGRAPMAPRGFGAGRVPDMSGRPRMTRPGGVEDTASMDQADREAFTDPLYPNELVLDDWQLTVVVAVVLDPKPPAVDPNAAPPAQTASVPSEPGAVAAPAAVPTSATAEPAAAPANDATAAPRSAAPPTADDRRTASASR